MLIYTILRARDEAPINLLAASRNLLAKSVEMAIPVHDLTGPSALRPFGPWLLLLRDRQGAGAAQGMINIDGAPFAFSILTNDGQEAVAKAALELIRNASCHSRTTI